MYFFLSDICDHQKPNPRNLFALLRSLPWQKHPFCLGARLLSMTGGARCIRICTHQEPTSTEELLLVTWLSSPTGTQAMTPTAEISPCLKKGTRPLFLFFGLLDFQVQTWRCAQCNFSIRKFINCAS